MNLSQTAERAPPVVTPVASPSGHPNILVVDDRHENLLATERTLRGLDAVIFKATSGQEALSMMLHNRFAVVLLDVQMPEMDGFETARLMREHASMRGVPIIFVTAISKEEKYATQAAEIGAVDYVSKPINPDILRSKVKVYLDIYVQHEQIMRLNGILRQSNEELERFAYICSHDMQEPVRMMNCYAELMREKYLHLFDDKGARYLAFIVDNARHMQNMILDILAFSRVGREEPKMENIDTAALVEEVLQEFETIISNKNARVLRDNLPQVTTSQTLLRVLFQNLIGNALKFQNGSRSPEIVIVCENLPNEWRFSVLDNGIGIDAQFSHRVFAIFQRIHRREEYPGTGIGLSTCKKFIELYGGKIWFESEPGRGSNFIFTIPRRQKGLI